MPGQNHLASLHDRRLNTGFSKQWMTGIEHLGQNLDTPGTMGAQNYPGRTDFAAVHQGRATA